MNCLGLVCDRKRDRKSTLTYFVQGLDIKKKSKAPDLSVVSSLTNVARIFSSARKTAEAHAFLNEAEEILNRQKVKPGNLIGYLLESRALAYRREGRLDDARDMIEKAVERQRSVSEKSPQYLETLYFKASICLSQKKYQTCVKTAEKALNIQETLVNFSPRFLFIKDCLDCLVVGYRELCDEFNYRRVLRKLESELLRVERELDESNEVDHHNVMLSLKKVQSTLNAHWRSV